jgi:branched-chain amino acid transport system permease protein
VLIRTADLALVAVGLSAVYALVKFPNISHVQYAAAGAYLTLAGQRLGLPFWSAAVFSGLLTGGWRSRFTWVSSVVCNARARRWP